MTDVAQGKMFSFQILRANFSFDHNHYNFLKFNWCIIATLFSTNYSLQL